MPNLRLSDATWFRPRTEKGWHKLRADDVTATSAAALFGVSPYMTPFDLFHRMAGNIEVEIAETDRMKWGKRLEPVIAAGICEDRGWRIVDASKFLYARSPLFPGMGASPDFVIEDIARPERGYGLLEIKNVDKFVALDGWSEDEAPVHIEFQLQHQLEACRLGWGAIGGLVGGNDTRVFERDHDPEVGAEIGRRIADMRQRVADNTPPPADYLADHDTIKALYRQAEVGKSLNLDVTESEDDEALAERLVALTEKKMAADAAFKNAKEDKKRADAELLETIGDTESAFGRGIKISATTVHKEPTTVEYKAVSYRTIRVSKPKQKGKK